MGSFVVNIGITMSTSMALYFYRLRMQLAEKEVQNVLLLFFLVFSLSIPVWILIAKKTGRKRALLLGAVLLGISNFIIYPWLPTGDAVKAYLFASVLGGFLIGSDVLLESILTDVVDYDHLRSGQERFGLYFGIWKFVTKFSRAFSLLLIGFLLDWANVAFPDPETSSRLSMIFGPGVGLFFLLAALALLPYPLTEEKCLEIKMALEQRTHG
jgi:GPH family glycoside/pentoside/hexuronide:cation symporter